MVADLADDGGGKIMVVAVCVLGFRERNKVCAIMQPRMRTRSVGRHAAESLGEGTGVRVGRGGRGKRPRVGTDERVDDLNGQENDQGIGATGENTGNVLVNGNWEGSSYKELLACNPKGYDGFCSSQEMQKLETELWNHAMVRAGHDAYIDRFHELVRLVPHLVTPESRKIERYVYGLAL
nr:reverse transcriptase domain-containing protein [Tanacetum cinerariifolium]